MQKLFDPGCTPAQYQLLGKDFPFPDLTNTKCFLCEKACLARHGFYTRNLVERGFDGLILVRRYICCDCGHTVSLLPFFVHPGRTYGTGVIIDVLNEFYLEEHGAVTACTAYYVKSTVDCSRQLLLWFRKRIEENAEALVFLLKEVLQVKAPPLEKPGIKGVVRQFLEIIHGLQPTMVSLVLHNTTGQSYLTKNHAIA